MQVIKMIGLMGIGLSLFACGQRQERFLGEDVEVLERRLAEAGKSDRFREYFPKLTEEDREKAEWVSLLYGFVCLLEGEDLQTVEATITYVLKERMRSLRPELDVEDERVLHAQIEELLDRLETFDLSGYADDMSQIGVAVYVPEMLDDYRAEYYARLIREHIAGEALPLWRAYYDSMEDYLCAYMGVRDSIVIGTFGGSGSGLGFSADFIRMRMEDMRDFAYSLLDDTYIPAGSYRRIPDKDMRRFYKEIYADWEALPDEAIAYGVSNAGSIHALREEEKAWFSLMDKRLPIYRLLSGKQKECFAHSTNRMQKRHAIQLRNRFDGYGIMSESALECLLPDDCSYERLYGYDYTKARLQ